MLNKDGTFISAAEARKATALNKQYDVDACRRYVAEQIGAAIKDARHVIAIKLEEVPSWASVKIKLELHAAGYRTTPRSGGGFFVSWRSPKEPPATPAPLSYPMQCLLSTAVRLDAAFYESGRDWAGFANLHKRGVLNLAAELHQALKTIEQSNA